LTLTVGSSAAVGTYSITITGAGGGVTQATPVSLTVGPNFTLAACPGSVPLSLGNAGRAFSLQPPTTQSPCWALIPLYGFCSEANCTDGSNPKGGLVLGSDGNLYGTTNYGGTYGSYGTVFRINLGSTPTEFETLYNFCMLTGCTDGRLPISGLVQGTNGIFYGTTSEGGQYDEGEVFELTVPGVPAFVRTVPTVAAPGASVTVLGNNLKGATSVTFNGTPVASFKVNKTGTAISTEVPAGANSGPVEVVTSSGTTLSSIVSFQVLQ
jgi:uncharacterized repeat protein (TIGR03803 family)